MGDFEDCFRVVGFLQEKMRKMLKPCADKKQDFCVCRGRELLCPVLALLVTLIPDAD